MSWTTNRKKDEALEEETIRREFEFMKKYGVNITGVPCGVAWMLEEVCRRAYNKGWMDCKAELEGDKNE